MHDKRKTTNFALTIYTIKIVIDSNISMNFIKKPPFSIVIDMLESMQICFRFNSRCLMHGL